MKKLFNLLLLLGIPLIFACAIGVRYCLKQFYKNESNNQINLQQEPDEATQTIHAVPKHTASDAGSPLLPTLPPSTNSSDTWYYRFENFGGGWPCTLPTCDPIGKIP